MKKLYVLIYDNQEEVGEWFEIVPFDEREEMEEINKDKTCFVQRTDYYDVECFKIKVDCGYSIETRCYPTFRYSIQQVEIIE